MSATGRGASREPHDFYATPAWCVRRLFERGRLPAGRWLEPCAGEGAIIRAVRSLRTDVDWSAVELRDECAGVLHEIVGSQCTIGSYLEAPCPSPRPDVILTNPPYSIAHEILVKALAEADHVVMLLRLNYLGSEKRATFFQKLPPDVYVLPNRPSFVKGGNDSCEYAWFAWGPQRMRSEGRLAILATTSWEERIADRDRAQAPAERSSRPRRGRAGGPDQPTLGLGGGS